MNNTIVINRRTPITLKNVAVFEGFTEKNAQSMAASYGGDPQDFAMFNSAVRLVDGSTKLAVQSLDDLRRLTKGRVLNMAAAGMSTARRSPGRSFP